MLWVGIGLWILLALLLLALVSMFYFGPNDPKFWGS
jgi:hypothetical protein